MQHFYAVTPVPKPRMTQRDKWKKRPIVEKYYAFKDACRVAGITIPESGSHITFFIEMPRSWSQKKRIEMQGQAHKAKPDADNLLKAVQDAVMQEDSSIWDIRITKRWDYVAGIHIEESAA